MIKNKNDPKYNRVSVPDLLINDIFYDAFTSISRDSNNIEVAIRIQKSLITLSKCYENVDKYFYRAAVKFQKETFDRCFENLIFDKDKERLNLVFEQSK